MFYQSMNSVGQFCFEHILYTNINIREHMHRHPELIRVRRGTVSLTAEGSTETVRESEYAFVPTNCLHAYSTERFSLADVCVFSEDLVPFFAKETRGKKPKRHVFRCPEPAEGYAAAVLFAETGERSIYALKSALYAVLGGATEQLDFTKATSANELLLNRIVNCIADGYTENITLRSVAKTLGYEEHYLSRCFHGSIPMHFSRYVNLYRVDAAIELLSNTDLSITEIAGRSGFGSIRAFNRAFREITGFSPRELPVRPFFRTQS